MQTVKPNGVKSDGQVVYILNQFGNPFTLPFSAFLNLLKIFWHPIPAVDATTLAKFYPMYLDKLKEFKEDIEIVYIFTV